MPTPVQIEVRVDENKTATSLGRVGTSIKQLQADVTQATKNLADAQLQLGKAAEQGSAQAKAAIAEYEAEVKRANEALSQHRASIAGVSQELSHQVPQYAAASGAVRLLEGNLNNMIRPAERFLATTLGLGPALQGAFPAVGAIAMAGVLEHLISNGKEWIDKLGGMTDAMKAFNDENIRASQEAETHFRSPSVGRRMIGATTGALAGADAQKIVGDARRQGGLSNIFSVAGIQENVAGILTFLDAQDKEVKNNEKLIAQHQQMTELEQQEHLQTIQYQSDANEANLKGFALLAQKHADEARLIHQQYVDQKADSDMLNEALKANDDKYAAQRIALDKQVHDETVKLQQQAIESQLTGIQKIIYERDVELQKAVDGAKRMGIAEQTIQDQMLAIHDKFQAEIDKQRQHDFDKAAKEYQDHEKRITDLDNSATNASLKGIDLILAKEQEKIAKLNVLDTDYQQQRVAIEQQANAEIIKEQQRQVQQQQQQFQRYTQQLGNDLYQAFNEITSGNIGKLIQDGFKRLFANILAQWIATVEGIKSVGARGGASGMMGSVLGSILGIGGSGPVAGASGPYGLPPGVAMEFDGSDITASEMAQLSSMNPALSAGPFGPAIGSGSLTTAVAGATLGSIISPTPIGGAGTGAGTKAGIGSLLASGSLAKLGALGALMLASRGGNSSIVAGGLLAAGGIGALLTNGPLLAAVAPYAGLLGPAAGGLIGFGLGTQYGPLAGTLGGAASGAATAAGVSLALGVSLSPATLGISALIGGLVGLFAGLFGHGPSKHDQADKYINSNVLPLIQQEVTNYEGFHTDFATAINDLEQLKSQSYDQMRQQFGKDATNDEWNKYIGPAIGTAEDRIRTDEAERQRRGSLAFGAPQFAEGGIFTSGFGPGGSGVAVLHNFERVMTRAATTMYGPELAAMEASAKSGTRTSGGAGDVIHIHAVDAASFLQMLKRHGWSSIKQLAMQSRLEGGRGF